MAAASSSTPRRASIRTPTISASWAPLHAVATMARSSRRRGAKIPGVSMKTSCAAPSTAMPRTSARVVWTLWVTIETLEPTSALRSVDLPTLGAPISATKPQRLAAWPSRSGSVVASWLASAIDFGPGHRLGRGVIRGGAFGRGAVRRGALRQGTGGRRLGRDAFAREHRCRRRLLGRPLRAAESLGGRTTRQFGGNAELGVMMRPGAGDFPIDGRGQAPRLRPLLQHRLGVAQRPDRSDHAVAPEPFDERGGGRITAIEEHRADQRFARIG